MRTQSLGLVLAILVVTVLPTAATAEQRPTVMQVIGVKVTGDQDAYLEKVKKGQQIAKRLGVPGFRMWRATIAGEDTGTIYLALEYPSMAALADAQAKTAADPEWQTFLKDMNKSGLRTITSSSLLQEFTP